MKLFIFPYKARLSKEAINLELLRLHGMINEGVVLLDGAYGEPVIIDVDGESTKRHDGLKADIVIIDEAEATAALLREKKSRQEHTIKKVEKALGLTLFDWQKEYIFEGKPYGASIRFARRAGKTLAHILRLCLSDGEPIKAALKPSCLARNEFIGYLGEDGVTYQRSLWFIHELKEVYEKLKAAGGIELREIEF